jgi:protein-disulfide isomerase
MKKAIWAGLIVLLAGGAFMAATAIDKKPKAETTTNVAAEQPTPEAARAGSPFKNPEDAKKAAEKVTEPTVPAITYGNADAPLVMKEFASFTCSHCAHFHSDTLPDLIAKYIDTDKVQLHLNSFIRNEQDLRATQLVYCVEGNEKRQNFVKAILKAQDQWAFDADFLKNLRVLAQVGGVSNEQFDQCIADKALEEKIIKNREYAIGSGVNSTPFFVLDGETVTGARDIDTFSTAIDAALAAETK